MIKEKEAQTFLLNFQRELPESFEKFSEILEQL